MVIPADPMATAFGGGGDGGGSGGADVYTTTSTTVFATADFEGVLVNCYFL